MLFTRVHREDRVDRHVGKKKKCCVGHVTMQTSLKRAATLRSLHVASAPWDADDADGEYRGQNRYAWFDPRKIWDKTPFIWTPDPEFRFQTTWQQLLATWSVSDEIINRIAELKRMSSTVIEFQVNGGELQRKPILEEESMNYKFTRGLCHFSLVHYLERNADVKTSYDFQYKAKLRAAFRSGNEASLIHCKINCIPSEDAAQNHYEGFLLFCTGFDFLGSSTTLTLPDMFNQVDLFTEKDNDKQLAVHKSVRIDDDLKWYGSAEEFLDRVNPDENRFICNVSDLAVTQTLWRAYTSLSNKMNDFCTYQRGVECKFSEESKRCIMSFHGSSSESLPGHSMFQTSDILAEATEKTPLAFPVSGREKLQTEEDDSLFRSIAFGYNENRKIPDERSPYNHTKLKQEVEKLKKEVEFLSDKKQPVGAPEIRAAAKILKSRIHVYSDDSAERFIRFIPQGDTSGETTYDTIHLWYDNKDHYDVFLYNLNTQNL
jgi:hypothetical protein